MEPALALKPDSGRLRVAAAAVDVPYAPDGCDELWVLKEIFVALSMMIGVSVARVLCTFVLPAN